MRVVDLHGGLVLGQGPLRLVGDAGEHRDRVLALAEGDHGEVPAPELHAVLPIDEVEDRTGDPDEDLLGGVGTLGRGPRAAVPGGGGGGVASGGAAGGGVVGVGVGEEVLDEVLHVEGRVEVGGGGGGGGRMMMGVGVRVGEEGGRGLGVGSGDFWVERGGGLGGVIGHGGAWRLACSAAAAT